MVTVSGRITLTSSRQPLKASCQISVTPFGTVSSLMEEPEKAPFAIFLSVLGSLTLSSVVALNVLERISVRPSGRFTDLSFCVQLNASSPITLTVFGRGAFVIAVEENAPKPISVRPEGKLTSLSSRQSVKRLSGIFLSFEGRVAFLRLWQLLKAESPRSVALSGRTTSSSSWQEEKASEAIVLTLSGRVTFVKPAQ